MECKDWLKKYFHASYMGALSVLSSIVKPNNWFARSLFGFILTGVFALLFIRSLCCLLKYQITEAEAALMIALAGATAAIFTLVLPDKAKRVLLSFLCGIVPTLFLSVIVAASLSPPSKEECFSTPTMTVTPTSTLMPALTSTWTPTPTPTPGTQVAIEIDGQDAGDSFCRKVDGNSYHIITVLDAAGDILPPDTFSYKWRFNPPDAYNEEKLGENFRCNAIVYYASPGLNSQTITVEVLKEKKIVAVRSICFNIAGPP